MFLRGFVLFNTGRKNHTDLRWAVVPLWRPHDRPMSNFTKLLTHPETMWTMVDPKDHAGSAATVLAQIAPVVDELKNIQSVADFRTHFAFMRSNSMVNVQIDFALADYLVGDIDGCEKALSHIADVLADHDETWYAYCRPLVAQIRRQLDTDQAGLLDLIQIWRNENVARLGLAPSC